MLHKELDFQVCHHPRINQVLSGYGRGSSKILLNGGTKSNLDTPDFRHKVINEALWINNWKLVKEGLGKRPYITTGVRICAHAASRTKNPVQHEVKEIRTHVMEGENNIEVSKANLLMDMFAKRKSMVEARYVFNNMPERNVVSWNIIILSHAKQEEGLMALDFYRQMLQEGMQPNDRTFVGALKACSSLTSFENRAEFDGNYVKVGCLEKGRAIHSQVLKVGFESNIFVGTTLIDMYVKCGNMEDAKHVFDALTHCNVFSWTAMILGYVSKEEGLLALDCYVKMQQEGVIPDGRTFVGVLKACSCLATLEEATQVGEKFVKIGCLEKGTVIHSQVVYNDFESNKFVGNTLVDMYAKCGSMEDARHVFDELSHPDVISWNAMILGYAKVGEGMLALDLYAQMCQKGVQESDRTFVSALKACSSLMPLEGESEVDGKFVKIRCLEKGKALHSKVMKSGLESNLFVVNTLVAMYVKCGSMEDARHVFDNLPHRDVVSWTTMILGHAEQEESEEVFKLYTQMHEQGLSADSVTFLSILKMCGNTAALEIGRELHTQICRVGLETTSNVAIALITMYAKCGSMDDAQQLFDMLPKRDIVTWTALISGYARQGECELVFHLFDKMMEEGIQPNNVTFLTVLTACSHAGLLYRGLKYFQAMNQRCGILPTIEHYNCMIDLLGRAGQLDKVVVMLKEMPLQPNIVTWLIVLGACHTWKNVELGRHAFEYVLTLDEKHASAYVMMSNIYVDAHMWEECKKVQVMRENAGVLGQRCCLMVVWCMHSW